MSTPSSWLPAPEGPAGGGPALPTAGGREALPPSAWPTPVSAYGRPYGGPPGAASYDGPRYASPRDATVQDAPVQHGDPYRPPAPDGFPAGFSYGYAPAYSAQVGTNGLAIASLVTSLSSVLLTVTAPVGLILGIVALHAIRRDGTEGRGLAIAGIVIGAVMSCAVVATGAFLVLTMAMFIPDTVGLAR